MSGRIVELRRISLSSKMVEVLTCLQDWEHVRMKMQHQTEDREVFQNFTNLYVNEGFGSN